MSRKVSYVKTSFVQSNVCLLILLTFQSQLSESGIEASDGLRVDDGKLKAQSILVKQKPAFFTVKLECPFLVVVENDNEFSSTSF